MIQRSTLRTLFAVIFVFSGACGLVYQIVWFKYLALFLGNTTYAQMIVLATFLGGLALGNHFFGRRADSSSNPTRVYASLELLIGLYCLLYPTLNSVLGDAFISMAGRFQLDPTAIGFNSLRFLLSALLLLLPTVAMGGTMPVLSRFFVGDPRRSRGDTATLYFLNSFGATLGIFLGGFFFIEAFGLNTTIYITAAVNIVIGALGLYLSSNILKHTPGAAELDGSSEDEGAPDTGKAVIYAVISVAGISGMAALLYEMVWVRLLVNLLGSSTYSFSLMLMAFITGITVGSLLISRKLFSSFNKVVLLIACQLGIGLGTMLVLSIFERLPFYLWKIGVLFVKSESTFPIFLTIEFGVCFLLMFIPTVFMGMALPLAVAVVSRSNNKIGRSIGTVFSVNTLGTVAGVVATGLVLIPAFGVQRTFEIGVAINFMSALILAFASDRLRSSTRYALSLGAIAVFVTYLAIVPGWNQNIMMSGVFRRLSVAPPQSYEAFVKSISARKVLYYKEGMNANVAIVQYDDAEHSKVLIVNGKPDASNAADMPTQVLTAQIPMLLHPNPKNALVIGFGSGATVGSLLAHPIESVDCAEIAQEVVDGAEHFKEVNNDCLKDKRLHVTIEDAHTYLKLTGKSYDVIVSEPSNPWVAGIGNLFSREFFSKCRSKLNPGGIMVQWFQNYETNDEIVELVLNTFTSVFPHAQLWNGARSDLILVGSEREILLDIDQLESRFQIPAVKKNCEIINVKNVFTFLSTQVLSSEGLHSIADTNRVNSETRPLLEFLAPRAFYLQRESSLIQKADERSSSLTHDLLVKQYLIGKPPSQEDLLKAAEYHFSTSMNFRLAYGLAKHLVEDFHAGFPARFLLAQSAQRLDVFRTRTPYLQELIRTYPDSAAAVQEYVDDKLNETVQSTTFVRTFPIDDVVDMFPRQQFKDTVSQVTHWIRMANMYFRNSQLHRADSLCRRLEPLLRANDKLGDAVPLETYYNTYAATSFFLGDIQSAIDHLAPLIHTNAGSPTVRNLGRRINWRLHLQEQRNGPEATDESVRVSTR